MSSFATATSRTPDKEPPNGKQLHFPTSPDAAPDGDAPHLEAGRVEAAANGSETINEVNRVERLLSQLEARSMALVPYGYGSLREVSARKSNTGLVAGILVAIWLTTLVLAVAYIRYVGHSPLGTDRASAATPLVINPDSDPQDQKVAASVDHLAKALVSSSQRMNELQAAVEKSNRDLQKIATKVTSDHTTAPPAVDFNADESKDASVSATVEPNIPKNWHKVLDVKPTDTAVPHKSADGSIDYWLVPRGADASLNKVLPIGTSAEGVVVHNLEDGKDYTLTPSGEWRNGALAPGGN